MGAEESVLKSVEVGESLSNIPLLSKIWSTVAPARRLGQLATVFDAVLFLHNKASLSHNNIGPVSVFISLDGTWKLGSFEFAQRLENCLHWCQTEFAKNAKEDNFVPPEDRHLMYSNVPLYARDVFGLGKLVDYLMPTLQDLLDESQKSDIIDFINRLTIDEAAKRPPLNDMKWKHVFRNDLYDINDFLSELTIENFRRVGCIFMWV